MEISADAKRARITAKAATQAVDFFKRYRGLECATVHRDRHDGTRHHMIHIDITRLLPSPTFRRRLAGKLGNLHGIVDVVICPDHLAASSLAETVREMLGLAPEQLIINREDDLRLLSTVQRRTIERSRNPMFVDDVTISGNRFRGFRTQLQKARLTHPDRRVHFLVGLQRAPSPDLAEGIVEMAVDGDHFHAVEELILPDWDRR
jgi:hypothetical protein